MPGNETSMVLRQIIQISNLFTKLVSISPFYMYMDVLQMVICDSWVMFVDNKFLSQVPLLVIIGEELRILNLTSEV